MNGELSWCRLYAEAVDDEKLRLLAFEDRWHFIALLCCKTQGILTPNDPLMFRKLSVKLGLQVIELESVARRLAEVGLIDEKTLEPLAWERRQFRSDNSTERVRAYRERMKRCGNVSATPQETETETETEEELTPTVVGVVENSRFRRADQCPHQKIIELYHQHLSANPRIRTWEGERPRKLAARWRTHPDLEWWDGFFAYVAESQFLTGRTNGTRGPFTPDLEWIVSPRNFQRINEGQYHGVRQAN